MNPASHFLIGWTVANSVDIPRKDRSLVTLAGVFPDVDGIGIIPELLTQSATSPLIWYSTYHHVLGHNLLVGLILAAGVFKLGVQRGKSALLAFLVFHLHLLGDLVGSRGPDGYQWPIPYLFPFSVDWKLTWEGQWELNAWPNLVITLLLAAVTLYLAWKQGRSPLEIFSLKADEKFIAGLRRRFGKPSSS